MKKYNKPFLFFGLSLLIPWVLWFTVAYLSHKADNNYLVLQGILELTGLLAPALVAAYLFLSDKDLLADLKKRFFGTPISTGKYLWITLLLPPLSIVLAQLLSLCFGHSIDQFYISGKPSFTSQPFSPWFLLAFAPIAEELAWHSYGTDALRQRFSLFKTSVLFAIYWGFWHLPLFFVKGYYQSDVQAEGLIYTLNFIISLFVFVIIMNWLYFKTNRNVMIAILFHLVANISNEIFATHPDSKIIQSTIFLIICTYLLIKDKKLFFEKQFSNPQASKQASTPEKM